MRTLTVDEPLLRRMARDASVYSLTRPSAIVMWVALVAAFTLSILTIEPGRGGLIALLPFACIALTIYAVVMTVVNARRAVRAATPPGTVVWVRLGDAALFLGAGERSSEIPYATFQSVRAGRDAVLLRLRGASAISTIPRTLLSDDDIARLHERIG